MLRYLQDDNSISFIDNMSGGAFVCRTQGDHELLFVNENLFDLFECDDIDDFNDLTGGTFGGMARETSLNVIKKDIELQIAESNLYSGYVFFNIRTKLEHVRRVVCHWSRKSDTAEGDVVYGIIYPHRFENTGADFDSITGLYGKRKFRMQIANEIMKETDGASEDYAIVYLNLVNFKLLNIESGVAEGDACLKVMADTLSGIFKDSVISRISDDHFAVFTKYEKVHERTGEAKLIFGETYGNKYNVIGKFGIYRISLDTFPGVEYALSRAKAACDFIKYDPKTDIVEYSESLAKRLKIQEYVVGRIDEAIEKGWIKVYFQPVIRSLTGQVCSMESLVRWDDPEIGFLPPDQFISTLENERCIHKLDSYVVDIVCKRIHERLAEKLPVVPVSVNFSRVDFLMCDMLEVVERSVEKYDIPRDFIHIEITESMIVSDEELMANVIDSFRKTGYEIWVDDFGSGYSSLTLLKDYRFDTLKLDMRFLADPFSEKSKSIMRSAVTMAKDIGMKTLAEGVETKEQFDFLREIGCGMIQGYYFGKPEPIELVFDHMKERGLEIELRKWRHFYEVASFNVRVTDEPLEILEDDGTILKNLYMNKSYRDQIFSEDVSFDDIDRRLYHTGSPLLKKYREFADQVEKSGEPETFYYTAGGVYLRLYAQLLTKENGHFLIRCSVYNITNDRDMNDRNRLDTRLRDLNNLFENVLMVNLNENTVMPLLGGFRYIGLGETKSNDLQKGIRIMIEDRVYPAEKQRCMDFLRSSDLYSRVEKTGKGYIEGVFRIKQEDGNYRWKEIYIMLLPGSNGNEYLFCMKPFVDKMTDVDSTTALAEADGDLSVTRDYIWRNILWNCNIRFFWKDRNRRFLGASQSFLDFYGLESMEELIGKDDDDMRWIVDSDSYKQDELDVINRGITLVDVPVKCIARGDIKEILCNKIPLYEGDDIVGLIGYFDNDDERLARLLGINNALRTDNVTGLMNAHALMDAMIDYAARYREKGIEYGLIFLNNTRHNKIVESYGEEFAEKVLKVLGDLIRNSVGHSSAVFRTKDSFFAVITDIETPDEIHNLGDKIRDALKGVNEVDGKSVTIRIKLVSKARSEVRTSDEALYEWGLKEVSK